MLRHFALWLALAAAIIFAGSGKALAQFSRSASIDLSSSSYGSGSGSFEHNPISRQFTFSGSFFGYSGYGSSSYARNNDNSIFGADGLYLTTDDGLQIRFGSIAQILSPAPSPMTSQIWTKTATPPSFCLTMRLVRTIPQFRTTPGLIKPAHLKCGS